ncbi:MAG TPA: sugar transferase [Candidatus Dojkabacteria bacterium]|nr:sugar transferase [Candidatus Dojkabacteria bacterium]
MFYKIAKRLLDIIVSIIAIIIFSPVYLIISLLIVFDGCKGPILTEINDRVGLDGKIFRMYKFRSMILRAHDWDYYLKIHPDWQKYYEEWKKVGKLPADVDPRITKVGKLIRKTDLDEIPQFFNVLLGNMSVVGPRAPYKKELEGYIKKYPEIKRYIKATYSVKPGITGIWQTSGRNSITIPDRFRMEAGYAKRKNIFEDIKIIIKTPLVMIFRKGVIE